MDSKNAASRLLLSAAREFKSYHEARFRLFGRLARYSKESVAPISQYSAKKFLALRAGWQVLDFQDRDWAAIATLRNCPEQLSRNYAYLAVEYILANSERVERVQYIHDVFSRVILGDDPEKIYGILSTVDDVDEQSIFIMKVNGFIKSESGEKSFVDYLLDKKNAPWVRRKLLYPMVYYSVNTPMDDFIDTFLSYMLPQDDAAGLERIVARHILRDELSVDDGVGFRSYIGLLSHPFDAFESLVNYIELEFCRHGAINPNDRVMLDRLADRFPASRAESLRLQIDNITKCPQAGWPTWSSPEKLPGSLQEVLEAFVDTESVCPDIDSLPNENWQAMCRMRWSKYPQVEDFDLIQSSVRSLRFIEAGRLFAALMVSIYMVPRQPELFERRHLLRLQRFVGATVPFMWAAPRGQWLMRLQMQSGGAWLGADLRAGVALGRRSGVSDRTWIHAVHWQLEKAERLGRVSDWLNLVRNNFEVRPLYLTGVDWSWVDRVLPVARITPFRANANGPYALLLRDIEERQQDTTMLRTAIEPMQRGLTCQQFVSRMSAEYGGNAVAFVKYFLTPENIMLLGMAPNMTAALSERISALEQCASEFKFGELLTEVQLRQEQQALTAALMLLNVTANQFDIPWASFRRDASNRQQENFDAYHIIRRADRTLTVINENLIPYSHLFSNRTAQNYTIKSSQFTLVVIVLGIVDAFIDHPSYGMEAILSTRFRHDTLRREFVFAFDEIEKSHIPGIIQQEQEELVQALAESALAELDAWLVKHMQTIRPGYEAAFFDFTPSQEELDALIKLALDAEDVGGIVDSVMAWVRPRLETQLSAARQSFIDKFLPAAKYAVTQRSAEIPEEIHTDPQNLAKVTTVVVDALSRRTTSLLEWFRTPSAHSRPALTFDEVGAAVEGRFESYLSDGRLRVTRYRAKQMQSLIHADKVRLYFDLLSEIVHNALKYSGMNSTRVRILYFEGLVEWGIVCSSLASPGDGKLYEIQGDPYKSLSDALFREGNSGLEKIGALSASIIGSPVKVTAERRSRSFHLRVPLGCRF